MQPSIRSNVGIIILAAGGSSRLGTPKQLLKDTEGQTFIRRITKTALSAVDKVACILGANHPSIYDEIADLKAEVFINIDWVQGLASSISFGTQKMSVQYPGLDAILFLLCDQPFVDHSIIQFIIVQYECTHKPIIACHYKNILGTPALFDRSVFEELISLTGDAGAGKVIKSDLSRLALVPFEAGIFDIDTMKDYNLFRS